ncbi:MAG: DNA recombination protein RmuC, partial [Pseudomonadota bacterium]|nr:DNA recombination protein RmuC [Pseudomonadota bacterium]
MNEMSDIFSTPVAQLGASTFTLGQLLLAGGVLLFVLMAALVTGLWRAARARAVAAAEAAQHAREAEARMAELTRAQAELQGRMGSIAEVFGSRQAELTKALSDRLDGMSSRLGQSITEQTKSTHE